MALVSEFPVARSGASMFVYERQVMLWGGMTQVVLGEGDGRFNVEVDLPGELQCSSIEHYFHGHPICIYLQL